MQKQTYHTDLTDEQWEKVQSLLPHPVSGQGPGRPREISLRSILSAIVYVVRTGCQWRLLPHDFPNWKTTYHYFWLWNRTGIWEQTNDALRTELRVKAGREASPSAAIIDSQSTKTSESGGWRGYDAGKKINGRKRHILVDTLGLLLVCVVHAAGIQDRDGAKLVFLKANGRFPRLKLIWADGGYAGRLLEWVKDFGNWLLQIVKRPANQKGFVILPRRWVVERTFAWLGRNRRLSKDYERRTRHSEAMVQIGMIHLMLKRLAPP
jgi:putative transposase